MLLLLVCVIAEPAGAFSDGELRAVYTNAKAAHALNCDTTTEAVFIERCRTCTASLGRCDASIVQTTDKGTCVESIVLEGTGGPDPVITVNGHRLTRPIHAQPPKPKSDLSAAAPGARAVVSLRCPSRVRLVLGSFDSASRLSDERPTRHGC